MNLKFEVNLATEEEVKSLYEFLLLVVRNRAKNLSDISEKPAEQEKPTAKRSTKTSTKRSTKISTKKVEESPKAKSTKIDIMEIRRIMKDLVQEHRDSIKEKLNSFGAKNVSTLKEENYQEFYDYLKSL